MRQSTLGKWMSIPEKKCSEENCLTLDWNSKKVVRGRMNGAKLVASIKYRSEAINLEYVPSGGEQAPVMVKSSFHSVPIMKSHLQKAVRRMKVSSALGSTRELIGMDLQSLLRRIPIIAIEDVAPVQGIDVCIWMMIAHSKGFDLMKSHLEYLLGFIEAISKYPYKIRNYKELSNSSASHFEPDEATKVAIQCLELRRSYGGMKGDMKMIKILEDYLKNGKQEILSMEVNGLSFDRIASLDRSESWVPAAIDFHVCSIARKLAESRNIDETQVRRLMWNYSSSVNYRQRSQKIAKEWNDMEAEYIELAKWWIMKRA